VGEIWTTNYDQLLERACPDASVVINDHDVRSMSTVRQTIIKMHGSLDAGPPRSWAHPPTITRTDFETYEDVRHRTWALLKASYLSRTMLFVGFSFTDPNVELLLQLARRYRTSVSDRHMTVMKRPDPTDPDAVSRHRFRVADLEGSGVRVCEIDAFTELEPLLVALVRRTRSPQVFVSGSAAGGAREDIAPWCGAIAAKVASASGWKLASLGGDAGWLTTREVARIRRTEGAYDPSQLSFHFRAKNEPAPMLEERIGTAVYTDMEREQLVPHLLSDCRAFLAIRGAKRTTEEIAWAQDAGVGVVPLAASGGAAHQYWEQCLSNPPSMGGREVDMETWLLLDHENHDVAAGAAHQLLKQAMYALNEGGLVDRSRTVPAWP
jgi:SIR2-like domain